jgi:4'-phosphopantetheinyl transferase
MDRATHIHPVAMRVPAWHREQIGRERVKTLSRLARQALHHSARRGGWTLGPLEKDSDGVPLPSNGIHWSLSHKETLVVAVAAPFPVGIDVEKIRPVDERLYRRVAAEAEWNLTDAMDRLTFFRFWTAKEAVLKAVGKGIAGLGHCRVATIHNERIMTLTYDDSAWTVSHQWIDDRHLAAVTVDPERIHWHVIEPKDA